jgi:hypothetical protein
MTDAKLTQAMAELQEVVRCHCDEAFRDRGLQDPQCQCDSAEAVKIVANRIKDLTAKLAKAVDLAFEECPFRAGTPKYDKWWHHRRATLAEIKGESHE